MFNLRIVFALFITLIVSVSVSADEAFDFYVEACRHSGYNPAEIATFQADIKVVSSTNLPLSQTETIARQLSEARAASMKAKGRSDEQVQRVKQLSEESVRKIYSGEPRAVSERMFVKNSASLTGLADIPTRVLQINQSRNESSIFSLGAEGKVVASQIGESRISISSSGISVFVNTYHLEGRISTARVCQAMRLLLTSNGEGGFIFSDAGIASYKKDCEANQRTFTLSKEKEKYGENHSAYILEVYEKGKLQERFWIDSDRGYICPKVQWFGYHRDDGTQILTAETIAEDFVLDEKSQKWFPTKVIATSGKEYEKEIGKPMSCSEIQIVPETLVINQPIPDSVFAIAVQQGMRIDDSRRGNDITFFVNQPGKLDLATVEKKGLDEIEWLSPREVTQPYEPYTIEPAPFGWVRIVLLAVGIIMIIWGLILLFFKRRIVMRRPLL